MERVRQAYASVAPIYIDLFGSSAQVHPDDLAFVGRHLGDQTNACAGPDLHLPAAGSNDNHRDTGQRHVQPGAPRRHVVLDVGCGPGHFTGYLRSLGVDAAGVDLVPAFIEHARAADPDGTYHLGSMSSLNAADHSVDGILAWYSLIHLPAPDLGGVLAEFRRVLRPAGTLVLGFFDGDEFASFDHKVLTAYRWPPDELSRRLAQAGFAEVDRQQRPAVGDQRPHAAIAAKVANR